MGAKADHDLWGQALAIESRYGDSGPDVLADRIAALKSAGDEREADFWSLVADCLIELHAIRYPGMRSLRGINDIVPDAERGRSFPG